MQSTEISSSMQQALPFLHASGMVYRLLSLNVLLFFEGGKIQVNPDASVSMEGHIFILNSIHSFLANKQSQQQKSTNTALPETFDLRSGNISVKVMSGKLLEQNVEGVL